MGNPGLEYGKTRHNFGFLAIDELARTMAVTFRHLPLLESEVGVGGLNSYLLALAKFFQLREPSQIIVIHDDLDIPLGRIKIKFGGGAGGHKGVASVIESLGTGDFLRVRLGMGHEKRPMDVIDYVLTPFASEEIDEVQRSVAKAVKAVQMIVGEGPERAMTFFHSGN